MRGVSIPHLGQGILGWSAGLNGFQPGSGISRPLSHANGHELRSVAHDRYNQSWQDGPIGIHSRVFRSYRWTGSPNHSGSYLLYPDHMRALNDFDSLILQHANQLPTREAIIYLKMKTSKNSEFRRWLNQEGKKYENLWERTYSVNAWRTENRDLDILNQE